MSPATIHAQNAEDVRTPPPANQTSPLLEKLNQDLRKVPRSPSLDAAKIDDEALNAAVQSATDMRLPTESDGGPLQLSDVVASIYRAFPLIEIGRLQAQVARGEVQSALGAYDTKIDYYSLNTPVGFYETFRHGLGVARQTWWGGYIGAGYRVGRGHYETWYKERQTGDRGEVNVAFMQPWLRGRAIDPQRVELFQANLRRQAVGPEVQFQILVASRDAAFAYWDWVEQGTSMLALEELLELAMRRQVELENELKAKLGTEFRIRVNNVQIYDRQIRVNYARMKFRDASFKLSLFLRDEQGDPLVPPMEWLPRKFPKVVEIKMDNLNQSLNDAFQARPELALINYEIQQSRWDLELARNQTLPQLDFSIESAKDLGPPVSDRNDKGDFRLEAGLVGGVPIQRNKAFGKIQSLNGKLSQLAQKQEFFRSKVFSELNQARNNVELAYANVKVFESLLAENRRLMELFEEAFQSGNFELLLLLEQEAKVTESEVKLYEAERMYFASLAAMQATLGLDPLDQAELLTSP
ncbi:MAG: TolC family protein [Pirellula sp.]|jgi:outer membrane protein TolC